MSWQQDLKYNITDLEGLPLTYQTQMTAVERHILEQKIAKYPMSITRYYASLIDENDPDDPIRAQCIPSGEPMDLTGLEDTSGETDNTVITGLQHKYGPTALILSTSACAMYCRHCFRKRMVGATQKEIARQFDQIFGYIKEHTEISNVLISGGDAFLNSTSLIEKYLEALCGIPHLDAIRFGTRTPVVFPQRVTGDERLLAVLKKYNQKKQLVIVMQFNHPRELTEEATEAIHALRAPGAVMTNQTVLLKGVNVNPDALVALLKGLTRAGVSPYYVFQCRPVVAVKSQFQVPLLQGIHIIEQAKAQLNGLGKCFRYAMSHPTGKIEILGLLPSGEMVFKYAQAKSPEDHGRVFTLRLNGDDCWLEDIPQS